MQDAGPLSLLLGDMNCTPPEAKVRRAFEDEPETDMSSDNTIGLLRGIPGIREVVPADVYAADERAWFTFPAHKPNRRLDYIFHGEGLCSAQRYRRWPTRLRPPPRGRPLRARLTPARSRLVPINIEDGSIDAVDLVVQSSALRSWWPVRKR